MNCSKEFLYRSTSDGLLPIGSRAQAVLLESAGSGDYHFTSMPGGFLTLAGINHSLDKVAFALRELSHITVSANTIEPLFQEEGSRAAD